MFILSYIPTFFIFPFIYSFIYSLVLSFIICLLSFFIPFSISLFIPLFIISFILCNSFRLPLFAFSFLNHSFVRSFYCYIYFILFPIIYRNYLHFNIFVIILSLFLFLSHILPIKFDFYTYPPVNGLNFLFFSLQIHFLLLSFFTFLFMAYFSFALIIYRHYLTPYSSVFPLYHLTVKFNKVFLLLLFFLYFSYGNNSIFSYFFPFEMSI